MTGLAHQGFYWDDGQERLQQMQIVCCIIKARVGMTAEKATANANELVGIGAIVGFLVQLQQMHSFVSLLLEAFSAGWLGALERYASPPS